MKVLVALCDILECTPNDLIKPEVVNTPLCKTAGETAGPAPTTPRRTVIRRPGQQ